MKKSYLNSLLDRKINDDDIQKSNVYDNLLSQLISFDEKFREKLKEHPELLELYEKVNDAIGSFNISNCRDYYLEGFKNGLLIGLECAL